MLKYAVILAAVAVCYVQAVENIYYLYTKRNPLSPETLTPDSDIMKNELNPDDNIIILIHGYKGNLNVSFNQHTKQAILDLQTDYNVIVVDWGRDALFSYKHASEKVPAVAADLAQFMTFLENMHRDISVGEMHLVGFGLGAHVAGRASSLLRSPTKAVARITGLDPSGSGWNNNPYRLKIFDAKYVEVIHTDGSGLFANGIGDAIGTVNFYVNGGSNQPGCLSHACSHNWAWEIFAASMSTDIKGQPCTSKMQMNLNLCRGLSLSLGGTALTKPYLSPAYRVNTGRFWSYT